MKMFKKIIQVIMLVGGFATDVAIPFLLIFFACWLQDKEVIDEDTCHLLGQIFFFGTLCVFATSMWNENVRDSLVNVTILWAKALITIIVVLPITLFVVLVRLYSLYSKKEQHRYFLIKVKHWYDFDWVTD